MKHQPKGTYPNNIAIEMQLHKKLRDSVAYNANISRTTFTALINGRVQLSKVVARRLAKHIGCTPEALFIEPKPPLAHPQVIAQPELFVEQEVKAGSLSSSELEIVCELVQRELDFMRSTNRNTVARNLENILNVLKNGSVVEVKTEESPQKPQPVKSKPVKSSFKKSSVQQLSKPWTMNELADALSAMRNGEMSNQEVATVTGRPLSDITSTKVLFGWMWHEKHPATPTTGQVLELLNSSMSDKTRERMLEPALL
jgi:hypothetical protein